jgi:hypothetical protein
MEMVRKEEETALPLPERLRPVLYVFAFENGTTAELT